MSEINAKNKQNWILSLGKVISVFTVIYLLYGLLDAAIGTVALCLWVGQDKKSNKVERVKPIPFGWWD